MPFLILASECVCFFLPSDMVKHFKFIWDFYHMESCVTDTGTKQGDTAYGGKERQWVLLLYFCCKYFPHKYLENLNNCSQNAYVLNTWLVC